MNRIFRILLATAICCLTPCAAWSGDLDSPGAPTDDASKSYTLEDLYDRLDTGAAGAEGVFAEPAAGPGATGHTIDDVMNKAPAKDDTDGATPADVAEGKTFWGLTGGAWGPQTGGRSQTGGRFTDNGDGTVTDNKTGLIWLKNANPNGLANWQTQLDYCNALENGTAGLSDGSSAGDWRMPNINELQSLLDYAQYDPALPSGHPFTGVRSGYYWSSSSNADVPTFAWYVGLYGGYVNADGKALTYYVWPVRGGN